MHYFVHFLFSFMIYSDFSKPHSLFFLFSHSSQLQYKHASSETNNDYKLELRKRSMYFLERYFYLILFNTYLQMERRMRWQRTFCEWMTQVASAAGVYDILDNFGFHDFEKTEERLKALRWRWRESFRGKPHV